MAHVFVSYAREDQAFVRRLHEALRARGRETWVDWEGIPPTARWWEEVQRAIEGGDAFLFVISPDSVASDVCRREAEHAFANQKRIVPLLHRDVADGEAPEPIGAHNWLFLRDGDELEAGVDAIVAALDLDVEWVRSHTRLLVRAKEWHEHGRDRSFVLRGSDLAEAERWLTRETATREPEPTQLHTQYILDSRAAATRAQRRRFGVSIGAVVVAVALAAAALVQRSTAVRERETAERQARIAQSRELAQSAEAQLATDPSLALLLAVEAAQRWHTVEAEQALRRAASASHERRILRGHEDGALSVTFSPDGESLLTTDGAGTARIWEPATGERLHELRGHVGPAGAAFSGDGGRVITWGDDGAAAVWDAATGERISTLGGPGPPLFRAGLGPDGSVALTAGEDGAARLWDADSGALRHELRGHGGAPVGAHLSPNGLLVVTHGDDERARLWDAATGDPLRTLTGFEGPVVDAAFSPDGALVVLGSPARADDDDADDVAIVFDARTGRRVTRVEPFGDPVQFVGFAKDGRHFLTAGPDGTKVWDLAELEDAFSGPLSPVSASSGAASLDAEFAPDGRSVATVDEEGRADLWSAFTGGLRLLAFRGHVGSVRSVSFDPSGGRVATAGEDGTVRIWDADPGAARTVLDLPEEEIVTGLDRASRDRLLSIGGEEVPVGDRLLSGYGAIRLWDDDGRRIAEVRRPGGSMGGFFTGDGRTILAANLSGRVFVLDGRTGAVRAEHASGAEPIVNTIDASPDGTRVVIPSADGTVRVVDVRDGEVTELTGHDGPVEFAEWSGDGARILSGGEDGTVIVWDAPSGRPERTLRHGAPLRQGAISADGARVASSGADATVRLWDVASGDELAVIRGFDEFAAPDVQLSPDGSVLLTDSDTVQLWDADSGRPRLELEPSDAGFGTPIPTAARFSSDGRWVAVADADGIVRIWDARSGAVTATLWGHQGFIHALHFGEGGIVLSSGSRDRTARRFVCETCVGFPALLERARAARSRPLTDAECRQFLHAPCPGR